jgi:hypothetical protein
MSKYIKTLSYMKHIESPLQKKTFVNAVEGNYSSLFRESCNTLQPRHFLWAESILRIIVMFFITRQP